MIIPSYMRNARTSSSEREEIDQDDDDEDEDDVDHDDEEEDVNDDGDGRVEVALVDLYQKDLLKTPAESKVGYAECKLLRCIFLVIIKRERE